ncbi:MAG: cyclic nucleotide-binding domain-containing protein [Leptospiraceae bacterium]|nr:cyclic nucleotide-binding domain-containing protein [Leptospiraceae bacterium]
MDTEITHDFDLMKLGFEGEQGLTAELFLKYGKTFEPRQIIIREGEAGHEVYLIIAGKVVVTEKIKQGNYKVLSSLGAGEIFGEMAILDNTPRSATLIAATQTRLLALDKSSFELIFKTHPRWAMKILTALSRRIQNAFQQLEDLHARR